MVCNKFISFRGTIHHFRCCCYSGYIGACRAEWVPGQNLATPHLMRSCGSVLSLHCTLYVHLYVHKHAYAGLRARRASSCSVLVI